MRINENDPILLLEMIKKSVNILRKVSTFGKGLDILIIKPKNVVILYLYMELYKIKELVPIPFKYYFSKRYINELKDYFKIDTVNNIIILLDEKQYLWNIVKQIERVRILLDIEI